MSSRKDAGTKLLEDTRRAEVPLPDLAEKLAAVLDSDALSEVTQLGLAVALQHHPKDAQSDVMLRGGRRLDQKGCCIGVQPAELEDMVRRPAVIDLVVLQFEQDALIDRPITHGAPACQRGA